ncbi:MAG: MFS transporter [Eggerthellaceae bacterium]|nr:MFS transporter [Eggerthellaceae bacterium]
MDQSLKQRIYPWLVVLGCGMWVSGSIGFLTIVAGNFYVPVSTDLGVSESSLGFYMTLVCIGQAIGFPVAGRLVPKMNIPVHMTIICAVEAAAAVAMSLYGDVYMWYLSGAVIGFCMGFNTSIGVAIVLTNWFSKKTGFAIGVAWAIGSAANAVMSPIITEVIATAGWRTGYVVLGVASAVLMCGASLFIIRLKPEVMGLLPYGYDKKQEGVHVEDPTDGVAFRDAVKSPAFILLLVAMTLITMTTVTNQLFTSFAESVGYGAGVGGLMVSVAMICDIVWNPLIGITCDKFGAEKGVVLWCVVTVVSFICLIVGASVPALAFVGAGLNDTMYACYGTGIAMLTAFLFGNKDYAKIYSLVPAIGYALGCMGVPILTGIFEATGGYNTVWLFCIACDVVIALCVLLAARNSKKLPRTE